MKRTHIWIGDYHAHPSYDNSRATAIGNFIIEHQPDIVGSIGDFADMPSLSSYDKGTKAFEGRRYLADVKATLDAQEALFTPIRAYNMMRQKNKKKQYSPRYIMTLGNHEHRINKAINQQPELEGVIDVKHLKYEENGWEVYPFQTPVFVDGIAFAHYFSSGVLGRPIGGEHIGHSLIAKNFMSSVQGHSHIKNVSMKTRVDGERLIGMSLGCAVHPEYVEDWCKGTRHLWWSGIYLFTEVDNGSFVPHEVPMEVLLRDYL